MEIGTVLAIGAAIVGVVGGLGGLTGYFQMKRSKAVIEIQSEEIDALKSSRDTQKIEDEKNKALIKTLTTRSENLESLAKQTPELIKLAALSGENHKQVVKYLKDILRLLGDKRK